MKLASHIREKHLCLAAAFVLLATCAVRAEQVAEVRQQFPQPGRAYSSAPLWVWNDLLTEEQIAGTMEDLAKQKVKQVFVHPRPGLMTPYLSSDWFRLWKRALKEAERLDMNVWIYDENSYPSGFAGGLVPEAMPDSRGQGLNLREVKSVPEPKDKDDVFAVFRLDGDKSANVTSDFRAGKKLSEGRYLLATRSLAPTGGWFGGKYYVDLLKPGVTEKFLEITMGAYQRELGQFFGKRLPGVFTDEPHLAPAGGLHWTDDMPKWFKERWGYDLVDSLPSLAAPIGDWKRIRHDYYQLLLEKFIERWAKPFHDYCADHQLEFTGHYWEHGWPDAGHGGDNMAMYAWHQRPSIDILMNQYNEGVNAQFGNVRAVVELASVANQMGCQRTLCEAYGAGGWDLRFEDMKRIGDWISVLGVNTLDEHLSYITIRGARKRDHPQSFSYHEPWWDSYHVMAGYFTRVSLAMSSGKQLNRILVLEPTTTAWMYQSDPKLGEIGSSFQAFVTDLAKKQVEFDIGCEDIMARHGSVRGGKVVVGQREYDTVVLPPAVENLNRPTLKLLQDSLAQGGSVLSCSPVPTRIDGQQCADAAELAKSKGYQSIEAAQAAAILLGRSKDGFCVKAQAGKEGILFHQRRHLDDGELVFLVNTSIDGPSQGEITSAASSVEQWDLQTGEMRPYASTANDGKGTKCKFDLPPCGSLLLLFSDSKAAGQTAAAKVVETMVAPKGSTAIKRVEPNVLTIDYVDVTAGDETKKNEYFYQASAFVFKKNGLPGNPWDSSVQFRDELIKKKFPAGSGFKATYKFQIRDRVPPRLEIVIERPDLYTITCNGKPVSARKDAWWLDHAFGRIDLSGVAAVGENAVTIAASPMTMYHELEPAYLLGDFALEPAAAGFVVVADRPIEMKNQFGHDNSVEGAMWLSSGIGYRGRAKDSKENDGAPYVVFDLGRDTDVCGLRVWNYNEVNLPQRGAKGVKISAATSGAPDKFESLASVELASAGGEASLPSQDVPVRAKGVRFVRLDILSNQRGVKYPTEDGSEDCAFVGLSEVRFLTPGDGAAKEVQGVVINQASSALGGTHDRAPAHLVDGSGLHESGLGWNRQGYPFYSAGVAYEQTYEVAQPSGSYIVGLGAWTGAVARVSVNGKEVGHIAYAPWQCDVTSAIKPGTNTITVTVVGTLKNTLGPHHAGTLRGAAWPNMFQRGAEGGQPAGDRYDTIDYGLFAPFTLKAIQPAQ